MSPPHSCALENCNGRRYNTLHTICKFCNQKIYLECMRKRNIIVKDVLVKFGLMEMNEDGSYVLSNPPDTDKCSFFSQAFNAVSPFGLSCELCDAKINDLLTKSESNNEMDRNIVHPSKKFEIYLSKFTPNIECKDIIKLVIEKTSLNETDFTVSKLIHPKDRSKKSFVSFLISCDSEDNYKIIMNHDCWAPFYTVAPFNKNRKSKPRKKSKKPVKNEMNHGDSKKTMKNKLNPIKKTNLDHIKEREAQTNRLQQNQHNLRSNHFAKPKIQTQNYYSRNHRFNREHQFDPNFHRQYHPSYDRRINDYYNDNYDEFCDWMEFKRRSSNSRDTKFHDQWRPDDRLPFRPQY